MITTMITCIPTETQLKPETIVATRLPVGLDSGATQWTAVWIGKNATCLFVVSRRVVKINFMFSCSTLYDLRIVVLHTSSGASLRLRYLAHHRLRGSASPLLTATHHSYGSLAWLSFFPTALEVRPLDRFSCKMAQSTSIHARMCIFAVKIATFHTPWSPGPLKGHNFANFWTKFFARFGH